MLDPKSYGLPSRTVLEEHDGGIAIVVDRKSRIVMADGQRILDKRDKLREVASNATIFLKTSAPVCSKTKVLLGKQGVVVIPL